MLYKILSKPIAPDLLAHLIQQEIEAILLACKAMKIYLFGSAARGEMSDQSDLDLLVVVADESNLKEIKSSYYCRKKTHDWPVDIVFMRQSDFDQRSIVGGVAMMSLQEGQLLFEAKNE